MQAVKFMNRLDEGKYYFVFTAGLSAVLMLKTML